MRTIETSFETFGASVLLLGYKKDNLASKIVIDCADALEEYQGATATLSIVDPEGTVYPGDVTIEAGVVTWLVKARDTAYPGHGSARIDLVDNGGTVVASCEGLTMILDTHMSGVAPDAIQDWVDEASDALTEVRALLQDLNEDIENVAVAEAARVLAEQGRVSAEELRVIAENARANAESGRVTAESGRVTAEQGRVTAEQGRVTAEQGRVTAEQGRVTAEQGRVTAEQGRVTAEANREAHEALRSTNESSRVSEETHRRYEEMDRADAEQQRLMAEASRERNESARVNAEQGRVTAEQGRASAEQGRASAEQGRVTAEAARETAEEEREAGYATIEQNAQAALSYIGPSESSSTASAAHAQGRYLIYDGKLYQATANIAIGESLVTTGTGANIVQAPGGAMGEVTDLKSAFNSVESDLYDIDGETRNATIYTSEWVSGWWAANGTAGTKNKYWRHKVPFIAMEKGTVVAVDSNHVAVVCLSENDSTGIDGGRYELEHGESITLENDYYVRVAIGTDGTTNISGYTSEQVDALKTAVTFTNIEKTPTWVNKEELASELTEYAKKTDVEKLYNQNVQAGTDEGIIVSIPNTTGAIIPNATIKLNLHKGTQTGVVSWDEVWSNNFKNMFWNVRPTEINDDPLTFDLHANDRVDFVLDANLASDGAGLLHFSDGTLCKSLNGKILISEDNASTWIDTGIFGYMGFIDSRDRLFIRTGSVGAILMMYVQGDWVNGTEILNLESDNYALDAKKMRWCEDDLHNVYYGLYRTMWGAKIYKLSTNGNALTEVYQTDGGQHVHNIFWDNDTKTIFAGIDNSNTAAGPINVYSTDYGTTWTQFDSVPYRASDYAFMAKIGNKYYGSGEPAVLGGYTLYATEDPFDSSKYVPLIDTHQTVREVAQIGNKIYAYAGGNKQSLYPQVFASDDGETWNTIYADKKSTINVNTITTGAINMNTDYFTPKGATEAQIISTGFTDYGVRCYDGDKHYHALMFVNVGDIPVGGKDIMLHTDYIFTSSDLAESYDYIETPAIEMTVDSGIKVNGTGKTVTGTVEYASQAVKSYNGLVNPESIDVNLAKLAIDSCVNIGGIAINSLYGTTFEMLLNSPNPVTYKKMGKLKAKEYILSSNNGEFGIYVKNTSPVGFVFVINGAETNTYELGPAMRFASPNQTTRITLVIKANGDCCVYANGGKYNTISLSGDINLSQLGDFYIGKSAYASDEGVYSYGIGTMKIYNYAMDDTEVYMRFAKRNYI